MNDKKYINNFNEQSYETRSKHYLNISEDRFVAYVTSRGYLYRKLGLNAVADNESYNESIIKNFSKLPTLLKSFPDFFIYSPKEANKQEQFFVELKNATFENGKTIAKIKVRDIKRYVHFEQSFTNFYTSYTICFPLADKIIFKSVDQILKLLPKSELKRFPNDSIEYFEIHLN